MNDVPPVDIPGAAEALGITEQQVRDLMAEGILTPLVSPKITGRYLIPPPPCGHMNGTHPFDCWWPTVGDVVYAEIVRLRTIEEAARAVVVRWDYRGTDAMQALRDALDGTAP